MRILKWVGFYIFLVSQLFNFLAVFAEKIENDSSELNTVNWEKVKENKTKLTEKIIWKSYKNDQFYFENKNKKDLIKNIKKLSDE